MHQRRRHWAFIAAGQADQPGSILFKILNRSRAFALGCLAHLEPRNELAEVLISHRAKHRAKGDARIPWNMAMRQPCGRRKALAQAGYRNFCSDMRPYPMLTGKRVKARRAVNPITIE